MMSNFAAVCQSSPPLPMDLVGGWLWAISLTRLSQNYGSNVCNIRRSSDNATTNVLYDAKGKISASSNVDVGGTLGAWAGSDTLFITSMDDLSGNGVAAVMGTTSFQPQLVLNSLNGQAVMRFNGTQGLTCTTAFNVQINSFFTLHNIPSSAIRGILFGNGVNTTPNLCTNIEKRVDNLSRVFIGGADLVVGTLPSFCGQIQTFSFLRNTTTVNTTSWEGNTQDNTAAAVNTNASNAIESRVGCDQRNTIPSLAIPLTGDITTIMCYQNVLTLQQKTQIARSLGHIGGLNV